MCTPAVATSGRVTNAALTTVDADAHRRHLLLLSTGFICLPLVPALAILKDIDLNELASAAAINV